MEFGNYSIERNDDGVTIRNMLAGFDVAITVDSMETMLASAFNTHLDGQKQALLRLKRDANENHTP